MDFASVGRAADIAEEDGVSSLPLHPRLLHSSGSIRSGALLSPLQQRVTWYPGRSPRRDAVTVLPSQPHVQLPAAIICGTLDDQRYITDGTGSGVTDPNVSPDGKSLSIVSGWRP
jgi:hypothetical protein